MQGIPDRDSGSAASAAGPTGTTSMSAVTIEAVLRAARSRLDRLTARQAAREQAEGALIVDIRSEPTRRAEGEIPGALILERNVLEWRLDPTSSWRIEEAGDHSLRAIVICPEGYVSSLAAAGLKDIGLHRATDVIGGFEAWRAAGCPVVRSVTAAGLFVAAAPNPISLDAARQQMLVDGVPIPLTRLEYRLLDELMRANGRVVTREELRSSIGDWPGSRSRSVDLHIHRIRRKLGPRAAALLTTEWGVGFRLRASAEPRSGPASALAGQPDQHHVEDARTMHPLNPFELDVAGGGGA
jgi:rhodanese-related sulfurtransferase/DNA-binding winged helix-turn-helix (wHTH) protein